MIPRKPFGRTGHESTRILFGAAALGAVSQDEADQTMEVLLKYDINHLDVANSYGDAELRLGPWMPEYRDKFFLATKTEERTYEGAWRHLELSLERLQTDYIDLWQMHILVDPDEWQTAMGPNGALKAFIEAKEQALVGHLGVTGHGVTTAEMHRRSLERYDFDSVLLPYNYSMMQNAQYRADFDRLMALCAERNVAVQAIKSICARPWGDRTATRATWYEPLEDQAAIDKAVHWVLANPQVFLNSVGDIHLLPRVLDAASRFDPATVDQAALGEELAQMALEPLFV
ncbi:MAG: aldo/keto reductase [Anaerolineae bacterium]|nr:aldo/keto reductase [Anaerolineae bacterium]